MPRCIVPSICPQVDTSTLLLGKGYSADEREHYLHDFQAIFGSIRLDEEDIKQVETLYPNPGWLDSLSLQVRRRALLQFFRWRREFEDLIRTGGGRIFYTALQRLPPYCRFETASPNRLSRSFYGYLQQVANKNPERHYRNLDDLIPSFLPDTVRYPEYEHFVFEPCNCSDISASNRYSPIMVSRTRDPIPLNENS